ncbi:GntR family transcriptional regulator [Kitasatospora sp. MAP5-34]|uniref:GntR family transcriptional regulator n=1 Tax=Kitasatospora sp. MAP5-34 TaxID=3035102 RepID=UPI0024741332|nr:GntR family transcriptional regulator [Kitasatospora sp. MAP5-34]MDH6578938.1 GntR family transcriptional regulator [Kitasatospora sp. MAP5-34]
MRSEEHPYLRIADELRNRIAQGDWKLGERLPSRKQLAMAYGVGANVLQRAQQLLITEGLLEGRAGSGTYVRKPTARRLMLRSRHLGLHSSTHFHADFGKYDSLGTWEAHSNVRTEASPRIAGRLGLEPGELVVHTTYEFLIDSQPVQLANSWEPLAITLGSPVLMPELGPLAGRGVVERMAAIGVQVDSAVESPRPARATVKQALVLGISAGDLLTLVERTYFDVDGRAVETADIVIPDARWKVRYELPVERPERQAYPSDGTV